MSDDFDPYYKWLGISPDERPANHYRLLAIRDFEPDLEVIESAADRQMSHVRSFQTGAHSADSQRLLNELSAARLCLLNPAKKALYDAQLRRLLAALNGADVARPSPEAVPSAPPPPATVDKTEVLSDIIASSPSRGTQPIVEKTQSWKGPLVAAIVTTAIIAALWMAYRLVFSPEQEDSATQVSSGEANRDRQEDTRQAEKLKQEEAQRREIARKAEQDRQREAAEEAQKKAAEEERQRQEREAAERRREEAEKARRMAEKPSPTHSAPQVAVAAPPRPDANAWKAKAERFAQEHLGRLIDDEPLVDGKAKIPLDTLPPAPATTTWFLGNGRIYLDDGTYAFGEGFEKNAPEVRYEIPALAADLHLKSAFVVLHEQGDVLQLAVGGVAADAPGGSDADKKTRITELEQRINTLLAMRRTNRAADEPDREEDEASNAIRELRESREELEALKNESRQTMSKVRRGNSQWLVALKQRCRSISALIYQPVLRHGGAAGAPSNPAGRGEKSGKQMVAPPAAP
jgi:hypothetical protein